MNKTSTIAVTAAMAGALASLITKTKSPNIKKDDDHLSKSLKKASDSFNAFSKDIVKEAATLVNDDKTRQRVTILGVKQVRDVFEKTDVVYLQEDELVNEIAQEIQEEVEVLNAQSIIHDAVIEQEIKQEEKIEILPQKETIENIEDLVMNQYFESFGQSKETTDNKITTDDVLLAEDDIYKEDHVYYDQVLEQVSEYEAIVKDVVKVVSHETLKYEPMEEFDISFYIKRLLENKTINVVKEKKEVVHYNPVSDFDISFYVACLLENKTIKPVPKTQEVFYQPMLDFDISFYLNILLKGKRIKPIYNYFVQEVHYQPMKELDVNYYVNILLEGKTITPIVIQESKKQEVIVESKKEIYKHQESATNYVPQPDFDVNSYVETLLEGKTITPIINIEKPKSIEVIEEIKEPAIVYKHQESATNYQQMDDFDVSFYTNVLTFEKPIQVVNERVAPVIVEEFVETVKSEHLDKLVLEINNAIEENEPTDDISAILQEIEKSDEEITSETTNVQKYVVAYPFISERKIRSIQENIGQMIQSLQPCTIVTLIHVVGFETEETMEKYITACEDKYTFEVNDDEVLVTLTLEIEKQILVENILSFANEVAKYQGNYRGWKVESAF